MWIQHSSRLYDAVLVPFVFKRVQSCSYRCFFFPVLNDNVCSKLNLRHIHYNHDVTGVPALHPHVHFHKPTLHKRHSSDSRATRTLCFSITFTFILCSFSCRICANSRNVQILASILLSQHDIARGGRERKNFHCVEFSAGA